MKYSIIIAAALLVGCGQQQESNQVATKPARKPPAQQIPTPPPEPSEDPKPVPEDDKPQESSQWLFTRLCEDPTYTGAGRKTIDYFTSDGKTCLEVDKTRRLFDEIYIGGSLESGFSDGYPLTEWNHVVSWRNYGNPIADFSFMKKWHDLEEFINFTENQIDVETLPSFKMLREFSVLGSKFEVAKLAPRVKSIEKLVFSPTLELADGLSHLSMLRKLKHLDIFGLHINEQDANLAKICDLSSLEYLELSATGITRVDFFKNCGEMANLEKIDLSFNTLVSLEGIEHLPNLRVLVVESIYSFLHDITPLHTIWTLEKVVLDGVPRNATNCPEDQKLPKGIEEFCFGRSNP